MKNRAIAECLVCVAAVCLLFSCGPKEEPEPEIEFPVDVTIVYTSDTRGYLEPCGCESGRAGGMARRATYLDSAPADRILLDAGNVTKGSRADEMARYRFILDGMDVLVYDAANLGARETALSARELLDTISLHGVPFVSANVLSATTGEPLAEPYVILERSGLRIGVTGVTRRNVARTGDGLRIEEPANALLRWLPEVTERSDLVVCLAAMEPDDIRELAARFFEIDLLIGGDVTASRAEPEKIGESLAVWVGDKGKYIGELALTVPAPHEIGSASGKVTELGDAFPDSPLMLPVVETYLAYLEENLLARFASDEHLEAIGGDPEAADRYTGSGSCGNAGCHPDAVRVWQGSAHAKALASLERTEDQFDTGCLPCHVTGFGAPSGFKDVETTMHLGNVQCEACHGPGRNHVLQMTEGADPEEYPSRFRAITPTSCRKCHDTSNSPEFAFVQYWGKVKHTAGREQ